MLRRRWLAVLIPGALWAFAHLGYVTDPYYLRGIELTISAVFLVGWFFLKFDLTTVIIGHMTYNAMLGALPMLRSGEPYFIFSGLLVVLVLISPVLVGIWRARHNRLRGLQIAAPDIGPAASDDLPGLADLPVHGLNWSELLDDPQSIILCLRAGRQVIGVAAGQLVDNLGELTVVYVLPAWRRYWGSRLADAASDALHRRQSMVATAGWRHAQPGYLSGMGWQSGPHFRPGRSHLPVWRQPRWKTAQND
jgi:hypothetical protein